MSYPPNATGCDATDTLLEIDMTALATVGAQSVTKAVRGQVVKSTGCNDTAATSYGDFNGIAASGNATTSPPTVATGARCSP